MKKKIGIKLVLSFLLILVFLVSCASAQPAAQSEPVVGKELSAEVESFLKEKNIKYMKKDGSGREKVFGFLTEKKNGTFLCSVVTKEDPKILFASSTFYPKIKVSVKRSPVVLEYLNELNNKLAGNFNLSHTTETVWFRNSSLIPDCPESRQMIDRTIFTNLAIFSKFAEDLTKVINDSATPGEVDAGGKLKKSE
ncbi:MAG: hypothetical protein Q7J30_00155 [Candidatus Azambacteria bacterium]|nr:hypothetical protein [Candidatus Azambacteria bacterium]